MIRTASPTISINERVTNILHAVDEMMRRLNNWIDSPDNAPIIPEDVEIAITVAAGVCGDGDVPQKCRELAVVAIPRFAEAFRAYDAHEYGAYQPNGSPGPKFWAAAKVVQQARAGAEAPVLSKREPIAALRKQGVSDMQIASAIYGFRGAGPFMLGDGTPDVGLLDQECEKPGSVIPSDWVPDWERQAFDNRKKQLEGQLSVYDRLREGTTYEDPESVEDLLRQGAFIQQIQKAKHVSRKQILRIASQIGVTAVDGPGYTPSAEDDDDDDDEDESTSELPTLANSDEESSEAIKAATIDAFIQSQQTKGAAEIAEDLRANGHNVSTRSVAAYLTAWKRSQKQTATV